MVKSYKTFYYTDEIRLFTHTHTLYTYMYTPSLGYLRESVFLSVAFGMLGLLDLPRKNGDPPRRRCTVDDTLEELPQRHLVAQLFSTLRVCVHMNLCLHA